MSDSDGGHSHRLARDLRHALVGGAITALVMAAFVVLVGSVSAGKAKVLLEATLPTTRFLCSSLMTVAATTLALMLTMLSLSSGIDHEIKESHYERIRRIALIDVIAFIGATVLLLAHIVPFSEDIDIPYAWYTAIYYAVAVLAALLGGVLVTVMIMLYTAVRDLIRVFCGDEDSPLIADGEVEEPHAEASA